MILTTLFGSPCFWSDRRRKELGEAGATPAVRDIQISRLTHYLEAMRSAGADLVILDCPPVHRDIAHDAASANLAASSATPLQRPPTSRRRPGLLARANCPRRSAMSCHHRPAARPSTSGRT